MLCIEDCLDRITGVYNALPVVSQHALLEFDKVQLTPFPWATRSIQPNSKN